MQERIIIVIEPQKGRRNHNAKPILALLVPLLKELLIFVFPVYPGFHFGLCPHFTLGYEEVSCLKALSISLNFDAVALLWRSVGYCTAVFSVS